MARGKHAKPLQKDHRLYLSIDEGGKLFRHIWATLHIMPQPGSWTFPPAVGPVPPPAVPPIATMPLTFGPVDCVVFHEP
jgi:hypothetical protein